MLLLTTFEIQGHLRGKGRQRTTVRRSKDGRAFAQQYADPETVSAEATVQSYAMTAMGERPPFEGPIVLKVEITKNHTASWSKRKKAETVHVTGKPDLDNIIKLIGDALNGIVWIDDSQICEIHIRRKYAAASRENAKIWVMRPDAVDAPTPDNRKPAPRLELAGA